VDGAAERVGVRESGIIVHEDHNVHKNV
jgi:hypothetical protein